MMKCTTQFAVIFILGVLAQSNLEAEPEATTKERQQTQISNETVTVTVFGAVVRSGIYEVPDWSTILEAVAMARGFSDSADQRKITVLREADGKTEVLEADLRGAISEGSLPILLKNRDRIIVVRRSALPEVKKVHAAANQLSKQQLEHARRLAQVEMDRLIAEEIDTSSQPNLKKAPEQDEFNTKPDETNDPTTRIKALLEEKRDYLETRLRQSQCNREAGLTKHGEILERTEEFLTSQIALAPTIEDRRLLQRKRIGVLKEIEENFKTAVASGDKSAVISKHKSYIKRIDAEIALAQEEEAALRK
ncbi:MAG: SLBB domain-containing protein [Verrucomicrobiae bacterium]|nr:SLBB domain-containing protein [Verrucomicrobiae bacterium]